MKWLCALLLCCLLPLTQAEPLALNAQQSQLFRAWFTRLVAQQLQRAPNPRWQQRDCAGLIRFEVGESLRRHDAVWRRDNSIATADLPPELVLTAEQSRQRQPWVNVTGQASAFVSAWQLVRANTVAVGRDINQAQNGDLLFFDQGDDQHLMIWMGDGVAYHTGHSTATDNGLRGVPIEQLMQWKDTRWQPRSDNPNFIGIFRFSFLAR